MSTNEFTIVNLVEQSHAGDQLAEWHVCEWGHLYADERWNLSIARREFSGWRVFDVSPAHRSLGIESAPITAVSSERPNSVCAFAQIAFWPPSITSVPVPSQKHFHLRPEVLVATFVICDRRRAFTFELSVDVSAPNQLGIKNIRYATLVVGVLAIGRIPARSAPMKRD